jgi:hypothetical protein
VGTILANSAAMVVRSTRWIVAAIVALTAIAVGCSRPHPQPRTTRSHVPITQDRSVVHAFDTDIEVRLLDRLELDHFLRDRDIHLQVVDGTVSVTGEVWTPLEKARVSELVRGVPGVIDVANQLEIRPPR